MISSIQRGKDGNYTEKTSNVVIKIFKGDKSKSVGQVSLNLCHFIDGDNSGKIKYTIDKCQDKQAYLELSMQSQIINQVGASDTMSMMSGFDNFDSMSINSGVDTEFNFKDLQEESKQRDLDDINTIGIDTPSQVVKSSN